MEDCMSFHSSCAAALILALSLLVLPTEGEAQLKDPKLMWESCEKDKDCIVIATGGCIGTRVVNREYEGDFRDWAENENARVKCMKDDKMEEILPESQRAFCLERRCLMEPKR